VYTNVCTGRNKVTAVKYYTVREGTNISWYIFLQSLYIIRIYLKTLIFSVHFKWFILLKFGCRKDIGNFVPKIWCIFAQNFFCIATKITFYEATLSVV
jgi:hypothetical protein